MTDWKEFEDVLSPHLRIRLISRPSFLIENFGEFLREENKSWRLDFPTPDPDLLVEACGRLCYLSFGKEQFRPDTKSYLTNLISQGHESVLEHATWSLLFSGISRAFSHQLVRHRIGFSFSQLSQQYHDESDVRFVAPKEILNDIESLTNWADAMRACRKAYRKIIDNLNVGEVNDRERKRALRSAARSVLPNCTETKIIVTANARALRHFLKLRGSIIGDLEMRIVCANLLRILKIESAWLFSDFLEETHSDGFPVVRHSEQLILHKLASV